MLHCGLLGETLGHSYSPMIHHALADYDYRLFEVPKPELDAFLKTGAWDGLNVTGVFHASPKTKTGTLESRAGWKGLIRKGETLLIVLVACRLDAVMGSTFVRDAVVIGFICNETISIIENAA